MAISQELLAELEAVDRWALGALPLPPLTTNDDYMTLAMELMNHTQRLLRVGVFLSEEGSFVRKGFTRRRAIVLGHFVRIQKLYDALRHHTANRQRDICSIFHRLIVETASKLEYLTLAKQSSFRGFILASYKPEKEMLDDLRGKAKKRPLTAIEKRMLGSVRANLREDRISTTELLGNRRWDIDGKNFRQILAELGRDSRYAYGFGVGSHFIHGDWFDLKWHHLKKVNGRYRAWLEGPVPDARGVCPVTNICLVSLANFVRWNRLDTDRSVVTVIQNVLNVAGGLDESHELSLQR